MFFLRPQFILILLLVLFVACSAQQGRLNQVSISNQGEFILQSPVDYGDSISLLQEIEIQRGEKILSMIVQVEINDFQVNIVGLTPMGNRLFTIQWDGRIFCFSSLSPERLPFEPERILADIQMVLWPKITLESGVFVQESRQAPYYRDIYADGEKIINIQYKSDQGGKGESIFHHMEQGYSIHVKTIQITPLNEQ